MLSYSYLNETLGLEDYDAFLHEPATAEKFELLTSTSAPYTHIDLQTNKQARNEVARSLAIFQHLLKVAHFIVLLQFYTRFK